jgi:uncharacterized membrane protein
MPEAIENYSSQIAVKNMKKTAVSAWSVGFSIALVWVLLILLAPTAEIFNFSGVSDSLYKFFSYLCHQMPERSFHLHDHAFAVCSRCFGVYFGLLFGFIVYPIFRDLNETEPFSRVWLIAAVVPISVDWSFTVFGVWENTHWSRFLTGMILGFACAVFIVPALVEIFQLLKSRKK